jgi:hypothetical protein
MVNVYDNRFLRFAKDFLERSFEPCQSGEFGRNLRQLPWRKKRARHPVRRKVRRSHLVYFSLPHDKLVGIRSHANLRISMHRPCRQRRGKCALREFASCHRSVCQPLAHFNLLLFIA